MAYLVHKCCNKKSWDAGGVSSWCGMGGGGGYFPGEDTGVIPDSNNLS